ncbi:MAG: hypothetical protein U1E05_22650 [Patescibacteria group bacterium]|nr:hypothetical protein [Patescibacteria group bacterium]
MASLDKAFIKAYRQQDPAVGAISLDTSGTESLVEALEDRPLREAKKQSAEARHSGVLAVLSSERLQRQPPPAAGNPPRKPSTGSSKQEPEQEVCNGVVPSFLRRSKEIRGLTAPSRAVVDLAGVLEVERTARIDAAKTGGVEGEQVVPPPHISPRPAANRDAAEPSARVPEPNGPAPEPEATQVAVDDVPEPEVALPAEDALEFAEDSDACESDVPDGGSFRPVLQVERIALSPTGERLRRLALSELDRLGDLLMAMVGKGRRVVAFASDRRGQGTTTLLSCVALRLAERRKRVVVADANFGNPQLATEFGLLPECGWERMLEEPIALEELVIESIEQSIALLPLCGVLDAGCADDFEPFGKAVATLREHYDLVLADLGVPANAVFGKAARVFDTALLVRDVRRAQPDRVSDLHRTLIRAGVNVAGVIESFVSVG